MSAPATQMAESQPSSGREYRTGFESSPTTPPRSSIKETKTPDMTGAVGYPDWFSFQGYGTTDESEDHSNLSDLLRDSNHLPSKLTQETKSNSAKKLVDEATAQSSPEMVRNKEKSVRYAISQPSHPTSPGRSTAASFQNMSAGMGHVTTAKPYVEEQHITSSSHQSQHSGQSSSRFTHSDARTEPSNLSSPTGNYMGHVISSPYHHSRNSPPAPLSSTPELKSSPNMQTSTPPKPCYSQAKTHSTELSSPRQSYKQESLVMKGGDSPMHQYESSSRSSYSTQQSSPRRHTFPAVHPYSIQPLPSHPDPAPYEYGMQPLESVYTSGNAVSLIGMTPQESVYTSSAPVGSLGRVHTSETPMIPQDSVQTQGFPVRTQGILVGSQGSLPTQGSPVGPQESKVTSVSRVTYSLPPEGNALTQSLNSTQQSPKMSPQELQSTKTKESVITSSSHQTTSPRHSPRVSILPTELSIKGQVSPQIPPQIASTVGPQGNQYTHQPGPTTTQSPIKASHYTVDSGINQERMPQAMDYSLSQEVPSTGSASPPVKSALYSSSPRLKNYKPEG